MKNGFIDKHKAMKDAFGPDWKYKDFPKTVQEVIDKGIIDERGIVGGSTNPAHAVPFRYKDCDYPSSKYLQRFLSNEDSQIKKPIKEDCRMNRKKSVLSVFFEDLENGRGLVGLGDDDNLVGAPGFDSDETIDQGLGDAVELGVSLDKDGDSAASEDHLFGDDRVPGEKETVAMEATYIKTKKQYKAALNALFHNLAEISILSYMPAARYGKQEHKIVTESYFKSIIHSKKPLLWESMTPKTQETVAKKVAYFQERYQMLLSKPTKKNAFVVERYLIDTNRFLREIDASMGEQPPNPMMAP